MQQYQFRVENYKEEISTSILFYSYQDPPSLPYMYETSHHWQVWGCKAMEVWGLGCQHARLSCHEPLPKSHPAEEQIPQAKIRHYLKQNKQTKKKGTRKQVQGPGCQSVATVFFTQKATGVAASTSSMLTLLPTGH